MKEQLIKQAYESGGMDEAWKLKAEEAMPELKEPRFKKGVWYIDTYGGGFISLVRSSKDCNNLYGYGISWRRVWRDDDDDWGLFKPREATPEEIREILGDYAKKRYLGKVIHLPHCGTQQINSDSDKISFSDDFKYIWLNGWAVCMEGKWAEIVEETPKNSDEIPRLGTVGEKFPQKTPTANDFKDKINEKRYTLDEIEQAINHLREKE